MTVRSPHSTQRQVQSVFTITDKEFKKLADYIKSNYGIHLKDEKKTLVTGRLRNVLIENNFKSFSEYYDFILADRTGEAAATLINKISTNHTFLMREAQHFDFLKNTVLPYLERTVANRDLRIWSAGCSSGEEAYTLAMIVDEFFAERKKHWNTEILATDISTKVIEKAINGVYKYEKISSIPPNWRLNYFKKIDKGKYQIVEEIRKEVIYRKFNLMDKVFPFKKKFHVIFCRNVMIYFDNKTRIDLINKFYDSLDYGGYLLIGHSESINRDESGFRHIMPSVYRRE